MRKGQWLALGALLGALIVVMALTPPVHSQRFVQRLPPEETLIQRLARRAQVSEEEATRLFNALGPAFREELARGRQVNVPGLGSFRVVRIPEHRDLVTGIYSQPVVVPAHNYVEFLASGEIVGAANSPNAQPADVVPPFRYDPLPNQTPGQKVGRTRQPTTRLR